jgi:hypothetical protein
MSASPTDAVRLSARALGPALMAFAGLLAWRAELGLAGAAAGGLLGGIVLTLHHLTEGWREARRAWPIGYSLLILVIGLGLAAAAWAVPVLLPALSSGQAGLQAAMIAAPLAGALQAVGAAAIAGSSCALAFAVLAARAPDLRDEGW